MILKRNEWNPIITRAQIPRIAPDLVDPTSVFNPGAVLDGERVRLMLRVQARSRETHLLMADSDDGFNFRISTQPVLLHGIEAVRETIHHVYDPRLTMIDGVCYVMFAIDVDAGCRLGVARTQDFQRFDFVGLTAGRDTRNGVLFPERVGGKYLCLERPNDLQLPGGPRTGTQVVLSESDDLVLWREVGPVFRGRPHLWDELVGSGPPPIRTRQGWLHVYHGVATHFGSTNIYQAGVVLLDLQDPTRVLARSHNNILEPRETYEMVGQVPNVVFPTGLIVEEVDEQGFAKASSKVLIYYGAADTCVALASTTVEELLEACVG